MASWDRRLVVCGIRALEEAEGRCARCGAVPGALVAVEAEEGSGRLEARCVNRLACGRRRDSGDGPRS